MLNLINVQSSDRTTSSILSILLMSSLVLATSGCGIPALRCAQSGAMQPGGYNWNNGVSFWKHRINDESYVEDNADKMPPSSRRSDQIEGDIQTLEYDEADKPQPDEETRSKDDDQSGVIIHAVKAASFLKPVQKSDVATDLKNQIQAIEDDVNDKSCVDDKIQAIKDDMDQPDSLEVDAARQAADQTSDTDYNATPGEIPVDTSMEIGADFNSAQMPHSAFYNDPFLLQLIADTMVGNQELKILSEEIRIACNEAYARSGEYRPFVTLGAGAGFDKVGDHTREGAVEDNLEVAPGRAFPEPLGDFLTAANLSWEIDIWRRLRNSQRAAAMQYLGSQEGRTYIITRVVAEVAENYYELLALDSRLEILEKTIEIQQASLKVAEGKKKAGRGTELAVQRFRAEVEKNRSERTLIQQEIVEAENRINFLAGRFPQSVDRISTDFVNLNLGVLSAGVPSELLQNRPDIRQAERNVTAAGLNVQVARARFYPNLSLNAGLGWNAFSTGYLFRTPESLIYAAATELVGPLINKRAIKAAYRTANAEQLQSHLQVSANGSRSQHRGGQSDHED